MKIDPSLGPSRRELLAQILVSEGGERIPPTGILVVVETQMAPAVEFWCHLAEDFLLRRESILA
jgi:hypothetical protein